MNQMLLTKRVQGYRFLNCIALSFAVVLPFVGCSDFQETHQDFALTRMNIEPKSNTEMKKLSSHMTFEMKIHGILLWAALGFLMPVGILIVRMSNTNICRSGESATRLRLFFYLHLILQTLSVLLSTAAAVMSIKNFENSFSNSHQRLGLALYCAIWVQAVLGFSRPLKESRRRGAWYFLHWLLGTTILVTGIINVYTGIQAYEKRTSKNARAWTILFTVEVAFMAFFYLFQDKWDYIQKQLQGGIFGGEPVRPSSSSEDQEDNSGSNGIDDRPKGQWQELVARAFFKS